MTMNRTECRAVASVALLLRNTFANATDETIERLAVDATHAYLDSLEWDWSADVRRRKIAFALLVRLLDDTGYPTAVAEELYGTDVVNRIPDINRWLAWQASSVAYDIHATLHETA
jgi:hypothetical protein